MSTADTTGLDQRKALLDSIVQNTEARKQAEAARADGMTAEIYERNANAYAIAMGRDLGLAPALALQLIHIIQGKPALSAGARAMFLKQAGYDWRPVVHTEKEVRLRFMFRGEWMQDVEGKPLEVGVTFEEAERAGWVQNSRGSSKVGNYDKIPRNMLHARAISNFHRWFAPEVVGAGIYDVGEVTMDRVIEETERITAKTATATEALKEALRERVQETVMVEEVAK
jgi:hypothetical protein